MPPGGSGTHYQQALHTLRGHAYAVYSLAWSPDGRHLATASYDKTARIWDPDTGALLRTLASRAGHLHSVAWSPDGRRLATASADGTAGIWDPATSKLLRALTAHTSAVSSVTWSPDGRHLATASYDKKAKIWDPNTNRQTPAHPQRSQQYRVLRGVVTGRPRPRHRQLRRGCPDLGHPSPRR